MVIVRPTVRWLLRSPRRFVTILTVAALCAVLASHADSLIVLLTPDPAPPAAAPASTSSPPPTTSTAPPPPMLTPPPTSLPTPAEPTEDTDDSERDDDKDKKGGKDKDGDGDGDGEDAADPKARQVAQRFARLWARPGVSPREWLRRLEPLSTPEYAATVLANVDPATVPASSVDGQLRLLTQTKATVAFLVPFDTLTARIELVLTTEETWRVADLQPVGMA